MPSLLPQSPVFNPLHLYPWPYSLACCLLMCLYGAGEQFLVHSSSLQTWIANGVWKKLGSRLWTGNVEIQSFILWLYARERVVHVSICLLMGSLVQAPRVLPHRAGRIPSVWSLLVPGVVLGRTMICRNALVCKWGGLGWANSHILWEIAYIISHPQGPGFSPWVSLQLCCGVPGREDQTPRPG